MFLRNFKYWNSILEGMDRMICCVISCFGSNLCADHPIVLNLFHSKFVTFDVIFHLCREGLIG
jgi:hypothetical protein